MRARPLKLLLRCYTACAVLAVPLAAQALHAQDPPYSVDQLARLVGSRIFSDESILERVSASCLGFRLEGESEQQLREVGASDELIAGLRDVCIRLPYGVESIRLRPRELELPVGAVQELRAEPLSEDSTLVEAVPLEWLSSDTAIADVFGNGIVVGKAPGEAFIAARTEGGVEGMMRLMVVPDTLAVATAAKSVGTATALGAVVPGGGEFYTGNATKGAVILAGSAAAIAVGLLITSEDTLPAEPVVSQSCVNASCVLQVASVSKVEQKNMLVAGAVAAGALWVYGLVDGILRARRSHTPPEPFLPPPSPGLSLELLPGDGIRVTRAGEVGLTLLRFR